MRPNERPFLDFYGQHNIIPVAQDLTSAHYQRRHYLYRLLGVLPSFSQESSSNPLILEVGAGTADNAVATARFFPNAAFTFVDGNAASVSAIRSKVERGVLPPTCRVINQDFNHFSSSIDCQSYDLVICEGTIPGQVNPIDFASRLFSFVAPNGKIVVTCADAISCLPELLRRLYRPHLVSLGWEQGIEVGNELFSSHLSSLPAMSRSTKDWVADQIFNPWTHENWQFSILDAIDVAEARECEFLGSSPSFISDWKWYKEVVALSGYWNNLARKEWNRLRIFTLDRRLSPYTQVTQSLEPLSMICGKIALFVARATCTPEYTYSAIDIEELETYLEQLMEQISLQASSTHFEPTIESLADFKRNWRSIASGKIDTELNSFKDWWGCGQQYVCFHRPIPS